jgi:hypothetical protein
MAHGKVSVESAARTARKLRAKVDLEQFRRGMEAELEHRNVTRGNLVLTGKIALAHLKERPDYYVLLKQLEAAPSLAKQNKDVRRAAHELGLRVVPSTALRSTPYRAMNPEAAALLVQPCPPHAIIYDPKLDKPLKREVMDIRHEVVEDVLLRQMKKAGVPKKRRYSIAHRMANKLQRRVGAESITICARLST